MKRRWIAARTLLTLCFLVVTAAPAGASQAGSQDVESRFGDPQDVAIVRIYVADEEQVAALASSGLDLLETRGPDYLLALLTEDEQRSLAAQGYRVAVDQAQSASLQRSIAPAGPPGYACYRVVPAIEAFLAQMAAAHPDLVELIDYGDSWEKATPGGLDGHDLWVVKITNQATPAPAGQPKPRFFLMSNIHARELATPEVAISFIQMLLDGHGVDPDLTWIVDHHETWVVATANPDGRNIAEQGLLWRKNTDNDDGCTNPYAWGVDLNRNHSFQWGGVGASVDPCSDIYRGPSAASEPEVAALEALMRSLFPDQRGPGMADPAPLSTMGIMITVHSYGEWVLWPWGMTGTQAPNYTGLKAIGDKFATFNGYRSCQSGAPNCLYPTSGATDDWAYGELGIPAYTFEVGTAFFQSCSLLPGIWAENRQALLYAAKIARQPYEHGQGPDARALSIAPAPVGSGGVATLQATVSDYANGGQRISLAEAYVDSPPWLGGVPIALDPSDGSFDQPLERVTGAIDTTDLEPGRHLVLARGRDGVGNWGPFTAIWLEVVEPDFALAVSPDLVEVCPAEPAVYEVAVTSPTGGYSLPIDLAVSGLPAGAVPNLTPPSTLPPATALLTLDLAEVTESGVYTFTVTGSAADGRQRTADALVLVGPPPPAAPTPAAPAAGAVIPPAETQFHWSNGGEEVTYRLQVALDPAFATLVVDESGIETSQIVLGAVLAPGIPYFWRVQAQNRCGPGDWSDPVAFAVAWRRAWLPLIQR
jgi:murein tripeptide amidase MpaA